MNEIRFTTVILGYMMALLAVNSIVLHTQLPIQNTVIWWVTQAFTLIGVFMLVKGLGFQKGDPNPVIAIYLGYNALTIFWGFFAAQDYWDYKSLIGNLFVMLMPIVAFIGYSNKLTVLFFRGYFKFTLPLFLVFMFFVEKNAYGAFLAPVSFILLFFPILPVQWRIITVIVLVVALLADLGARSTVIRFALPVLIVSSWYLGIRFSKFLMETGRLLMLFVPFLLFTLAVLNVFNPFDLQNMSDTELVITAQSGTEETEDLLVDTRTFLYREVLTTLNNHNAWIIGRSPARGNETEFFYNDMMEMYGKPERYSNEVGILNILTYTGAIGVILYFLIFYRSSFLAMHRSNNAYCKWLGLIVAFRWFYSWVEEINDFTLSYFFMWISIGLCSSASFRKMNDKEVAAWVKSIFSEIAHPIIPPIGYFRNRI